MGVELPNAEGPSNRLPSIGLASVPVALGVPLEGAGEFRIAFAAPGGALGEIDAASQIGSGGACEAVEGGGNRRERQTQV